MASLRRFQGLLQRIYDVAVDHDVDDFLITNPQLARVLDTSRNPRDIEEKLLLRQDEDDLALSLFVHDEVMARLLDDDPHRRLHDGNLDDFCTALEGVSHFLYLIWNATRERSVRQVELEMQAEVDKYLAVAELLAHQHNRSVPDGLHRWLFQAQSFDRALDASERVRYVDANYYAAKYCYYLEQRYLRAATGDRGTLRSEVRQFYRLPFADKIRRIENPGPAA